MRARGRRAFVALAILLVAAGALAYAVAKAPRLDLVPVARAFLVDLDEGRHLQALNGSLMQDRWDLVGLLESNAARQRRLGKVVRLEAVGAEEEVALPAGLAHGSGRRIRMRGTFERGTQEVVFTFARRGATWVVRDFDLPSLDPAERPGLDVHLRRVAGEVVDQVGRLQWADVHNRLVRAERIATPVEVWAAGLSPRVEGLGLPRAVEERGWRFADGRGTFAATLVFEEARRDVEVDVVYDRSEGRAVVARLAFLP